MASESTKTAAAAAAAATSTIELIKKARETVMASCKGPTPQDALVRPQFDMAGVHTMLLTGLLNLYEKATTVPKAKHPIFTVFALMWVAHIEYHHHFEEHIYYPMFSKKFDLDTITAEHGLFSDGMKQMQDYLCSTLPKGTSWGFQGETVQTEKSADYDGEKLRSIVDGFIGPLTTHLQAEIEYLDPQKLRDAGLTVKDILETEVVVEKYIKSYPPTGFVVWGYLHTPKGLAFPPIPKFVKHFLIPWVFYWANRTYWQFAPKL